MLGGEWFEELFGSPQNADKKKILEYALEASRHHLGYKSDPIRTIVRVHEVRTAHFKFDV